MRPADRDVSRLPKWAQDRIASLERDVEHLRATLAVGPEDSDTFCDPYLDQRPLGRGQTIRFVLDRRADHRPDVYIDAKLDAEGGCVAIRCADGSLAITPTHANEILVRVAPLGAGGAMRTAAPSRGSRGRARRIADKVERWVDTDFSKWLEAMDGSGAGAAGRETFMRDPGGYLDYFGICDADVVRDPDDPDGDDDSDVADALGVLARRWNMTIPEV